MDFIRKSLQAHLIMYCRFTDYCVTRYLFQCDLYPVYPISFILILNLESYSFPIYPRHVSCIHVSCMPVLYPCILYSCPVSMYPILPLNCIILCILRYKNILRKVDPVSKIKLRITDTVRD